MYIFKRYLNAKVPLSLSLQVVTIATYAFFLAAIVGRQFVEESKVPHKKKVDLYIPFFTILQFFFYMGLLKVRAGVCPCVCDDDNDNSNDNNDDNEILLISRSPSSSSTHLEMTTKTLNSTG